MEATGLSGLSPVATGLSGRAERRLEADVQAARYGRLARLWKARRGLGASP